MSLSQCPYVFGDNRTLFLIHITRVLYMDIKVSLYDAGCM